MTAQTTPRKNIKWIILAGIAALIVVGLFVTKLVVENKIKAWATEDLSLYEPLLKLESAKVKASWFGSSVAYKDVIYSIPDAPGLTIIIDEMIQSGIDGDTLMGKPGDVTTIDRISMRGLRALLEGYETPILEIGYYEENDITFPYRDTRAALMAYKGSDDALGLLQTMLPIISSSPMRSGASRVSDFKINLSQFGVADLSLGLITASGFREMNRETDGFDGALDNAAYKDLKISGMLPDGSELLATLDSLELKGLKFNYLEMLEALAGFDEQADPVGLLLSALPSLYNYKFDEITASNLSVSAAGALFTLEKINLGPRTLKEQGPNSLSNIKVVMNGMNVFSLETIGLDKLVLSDTIVDFINNPDEYVNDSRLLLDFYENPLVPLHGTFIENFHVKNLNASGLVKLDNWRSDIHFDEGVTITSLVEALHVSNIGLRQASMALSPADASLKDLIEVLAMNSAGLTLNSGLEFNFGLSEQSLIYDLNFDLAAQEQGALSFMVSGLTGEPRNRYEAYGEPLFYDMAITIVDKGILNNIFKYMAAQGLAADAAAARDALVDELETNIAEAGPDEAALLRGIKSFMLQGGKLSVSLEPDYPAALNEGELFYNLEDLNISVTHSK